MSLFNSDWDTVGPAMLQLNASGKIDGHVEMSRKIRDFYFKPNQSIGLDGRWEFTDMISDRQWVHPTWVTATLYSKVGINFESTFFKLIFCIF